MKTKELRPKNETDLNELLKSKRKALLDFRFAVAGGEAKNVKEGRNTRKAIARILTLLKEKSEK